MGVFPMQGKWDGSGEPVFNGGSEADPSVTGFASESESGGVFLEQNSENIAFSSLLNVAPTAATIDRGR